MMINTQFSTIFLERSKQIQKNALIYLFLLNTKLTIKFNLTIERNFPLNLQDCCHDITLNFMLTKNRNLFLYQNKRYKSYNYTFHILKERK